MGCLNTIIMASNVSTISKWSMWYAPTKRKLEKYSNWSVLEEQVPGSAYAVLKDQTIIELIQKLQLSE